MTPSSSDDGGADGLWWVRGAVFAGAVLAVFLVPFLFPPQSGISMSYRFGFNNRVALGTLLAVTLGFGLWSRGWGMRLDPMRPVEAPGRAGWLVGGCAGLAGGLALLLWLRAPWAAAGGELSYFLDRYAMVELGFKPFRTMTFDYGPLMFYPTVWVHAATALTLRNSYFVCWGAAWMAGTALLWDTLRRIAAAPAYRLGVFVLLFALLLPSLYSGGLNYTPLRYVLAPWFAMLVYGVQRRSVARALLLAFAGFCTVLLYSPEQGVSFLLATLLFFGACVRGRVVVVPLLVFGGAAGGTLAVARHLGLLQSMLDFGGGGYDLPLLLNTETLLLVALLVLSGCVVIRAFFDGATNRPELYLVAIAAGLLPSALGRADPGHLLINTMPASAVALLALGRKRGCRVPCVLVCACVIAQTTFMQIWPGFYGAFGPHVGVNLRQMLHAPGGGDTVRIAAERAAVDVVLRGRQQAHLFAPLGYLQPGWPAPPLPIATGRFFGFGLVSERFVEAKLAEIDERGDPVLLLPAAYKSFCWTPDAPYLRGVIRAVLNPWYVPTVKHTGNAAMPMCRYLEAHYAATPEPAPVPGFVLVQRTDAFSSGVTAAASSR